MIKKSLLVATISRTIILFCKSIIKEMQKQGFEVHVACCVEKAEHKGVLEDIGAIVHDIPASRNPIRLSNFTAYRLLKNIIMQHNFDIIHCHTPVGGFLTRLAARKSRELGTKVIYTAHGFHFYKGAPLFNWLIYYPIEKYLAKYTDILITINTEDYEIAKKFFLKKKKNLHYLPGVGIDIDKFSKVKVNHEEKRESLKLHAYNFIIISVGEINKNKNHIRVIKAIRTLDNRNIKFIICGGSDNERYLNRLKNYVERKYLTNQIEFLGQRDDIPSLLSISDLLIHPSKREGLPMAIMEAMASGLPVIASDIRGNRDLIKDGENGILFKLNNTNKLSEQIDKLLKDEDSLNLIANNGRKSIREFSKEAVNAKMKEIYKGLSNKT